jgi:hypothetical protein
MPNLRNDTLLETDESQYLLVDGTRTATSLVVAGSSASTLLRITQTGAGNALVVEDEANPDATPFVVDASGNVGIAISSPTVKLDVLGSTTIGTQGNVTAAFGSLSTGRLLVGSITGNTPFIGSESTNPLAFTTNGVERMRIDSTGQVGIGSATAAGYNILAGKNLTGAVNTYGMVIQGQIQSDSTSSATTFASAPSTAAAAFTVGTLNHFSAVGISTPGAGSALTNQIGFNAGSGISGATNNFGFSGNISSGTGRYNLYMSGTAANYLAGRLGVGATNTSGQMAAIVNTTAGDYALLIKGAVSQTGDLLNIQNSAGTILSRIDSSGTIFDIGLNLTTQSAVIQLGNGRSGNGYSYIDLVGDATYTDYGLRLMRENAGANTNSFLTHRGTGALYLTAFDAGSVAIQTSSTTRMTVDSAGRFGMGTTTSAGRSINLGVSMTGATQPNGIFNAGAIQSDATSGAIYYNTWGNTAAGAGAIPSVQHYQAQQGSIGASSSIGTQVGFIANSTLTGASNNWGFQGDIAAAANRYNLYMSGTAGNYMLGRLGVGAILASGAMVQIVNTTAADKALIVKGAASQSGNLQEWQNSAGTVLAYIAADGSSSLGRAADDAQAIIAGSVFS